MRVVLLLWLVRGALHLKACDTGRLLCIEKGAALAERGGAPLLELSDLVEEDLIVVAHAARHMSALTTRRTESEGENVERCFVTALTCLTVGANRFDSTRRMSASN